jgi:hypothetical protein
MIREYAHLPLNQPVESPAASYWVSQEVSIPYNGNEALCIVRETSPIVSCCAGSSCGFRSVLVPGFIKRLRYKTREDGLVVSDIEPIEDEKVMEELRRVIQEKYNSIQVEFFCP